MSGYVHINRSCLLLSPPSSHPLYHSDSCLVFPIMCVTHFYQVYFSSNLSFVGEDLIALRSCYSLVLSMSAALMSPWWQERDNSDHWREGQINRKTKKTLVDQELKVRCFKGITFCLSGHAFQSTHNFIFLCVSFLLTSTYFWPTKRNMDSGSRKTFNKGSATPLTCDLKQLI